MLNEKFYRCKDCENAWFIEVEERVIQKDGPGFTREDLQVTGARTIQRRFSYRCSSCMKPLERVSSSESF